MRRSVSAMVKPGLRPARPEGDYGTAAPWVPWLWLGLGLLYLVLTVINALGGAGGWAVLALGAVAG